MSTVKGLRKTALHLLEDYDHSTLRIELWPFACGWDPVRPLQDGLGELGRLDLGVVRSRISLHLLDEVIVQRTLLTSWRGLWEEIEMMGMSER